MYRQYANKLLDGRKNVCGVGIKKLRKASDTIITQLDLANEMQRKGLDCDKNMIQKIEAGARYVTDFELHTLADIFGVTMDEIMDMSVNDDERSRN